MRTVMPLFALTPLLSVTLAACGGGTAPTAPATPAGLSAVQQQVIDLSEEERAGVLLRAIRDARLECQGVTRAERHDDTTRSGQPTWIATCTDGRQFPVTITADGTALVVGAR